MMLKDEKGNWSTARILLVIYTAFFGVALFVNASLLNREVLQFMTAIELALIGWAGGARISQYLLPNISKILGKIGGKDIPPASKG